MESLSTLTGDHPIVGDVRGLGLLCAIEMVSDRVTKAGFDPELAAGRPSDGQVQPNAD